MLRIFLPSVVIIALSLAPFSRSTPQDKKVPCGCDNLDACLPKKEKKTPPPTKKPPKPVEYGQGEKKVTIYPPILDKDLPGLDQHTGTAEDTEHNYLLGKANLSGHFPQRRRYIHNVVSFGRQAYANGEITRAEFDSLTGIMKGKLEAVNKEEVFANSEAHKEANRAGLEATKEALKKGGQVDKENEQSTNDTLAAIEKMDLDSYETQSASIEQVVFDNLAQARALELLGLSDPAALDRARKLADKLFEKINKDCQGAKLDPFEVGKIARMAMFLGSATQQQIDDMTAKCFSRTLVARADFEGKVYEARRCITTAANRESMAGKWELKISGQMTGNGKIELDSAGGGSWSGNVMVVSLIPIYMQGPAELVSSGSKCFLRITSAEGTATVEQREVTRAGKSGDLPIEIVNEICVAK